MTFDPNQLSPEPWEFDEDGLLEGICRMVDHGNANTIARTGEYFSHTDARFIELARAAFGVMLRRGWHPKLTCGHQWVVHCDRRHWHSCGPESQIPFMRFNDPYTALVEVDKWYTANIEKAGGS